MSGIIFTSGCWEEAVMTDFARLMSDYFVKYLAGQKGSGSNTMKTYRDTFVQLLGTR